MSEELHPRAVFRVLDTGFGMTVQDRGRTGWRRFGVPPSGFMDPRAAASANRLLDNPSITPAIELLLQGAVIEVLRDVWIALCGAELRVNMPMWRAYRATAGETIRIAGVSSGMWSYLAVESGLDWPAVFGSASYYARGGVGQPIEKGTELQMQSRAALHLPKTVHGRFASWSDRLNHDEPPAIKVWKGPQWDLFPSESQAALLETAWEVSPRSDRVGYRLIGPAAGATVGEIPSEPVRLGSIQVPAGGEPIVTMPDGPTVGGYPKIAVVDSGDLPWLAQSRPGNKIKFELVEK